MDKSLFTLTTSNLVTYLVLNYAGLDRYCSYIEQLENLMQNTYNTLKRHPLPLRHAKRVSNDSKSMAAASMRIAVFEVQAAAFKSCTKLFQCLRNNSVFFSFPNENRCFLCLCA